MTYRVYCDGQLIYSSKLESMKIGSPSVELESNKTGSFIFTMYADHPYYSLIKRLKSIITVYQDDYLLFRGRVLDEETGWHNEKTVTCEGELAFFLDSIQRPYDYTGTVAGYIGMLVDNHNSQVEEAKRFTVGNITVTDNNDYIVRSNIDYVETWKEIEDKLIGLMGGYLMVRHEGGVNYLDYLADGTLLSPQSITFGINLLDLKRVRNNGADIATAVIPLGAKLKNEEDQDTDVRLTVESVNGGSDMLVDAEAVAQYGAIVKTVVYDDVTEPENLLIKGQAYLRDLVNLPETIELTAADLAATGADILSFHIGTKVRVKSAPHGIEQIFMVEKLSIDLLSPAANKLTLGGVISGISGTLTGVSSSQNVILREIEGNVRRTNEALYNVERNALSAIQQAADNISAKVSEDYYLKDDTDSLISKVSTELSLQKDQFEIQFTEFNRYLEAAVNKTDADFEEIRKYIRFVDGKILLGEIGNELELEISNDRISFLQGGAEVAYFSNRRLYVTDAQFLNSLQLGSFAFVPRANGNLSFKKV